MLLINKRCQRAKREAVRYIMSLLDKNAQYFLTLAKEKSFSKAAEQLLISQSYLSQFIRKLEDTVDTQLFDRTQSSIELTEAGKVYFEYLEKSNHLYTKLMADLDSLNKQRSHQLNLGFAPWRGSTLLPDILPTFIKRYPNIQIILHEQSIKETYKLIEKNIVDIGIMDLASHSIDNITSEFIMDENIVLAANIYNPITEQLMLMEKNNEIIDLSMLADECFILIKQGLSCAERVTHFLQNKNINFKKKIITTNKTTALNLVAANIGFCFIPETGAHWSSKPDVLRFINLRSKELLSPLVAVYKRNTFLSPLARNFIDITKAYYSNNKL